ncbi:porin family protein [Spirosoma montaniterrae]|uniref:Outer membrane protein beta-barrel domain-containing protein n=1 Tax=Spirosoma montaniterrae TaxID=1178516 RepID=A0A1P9WYC2_9BACT|nr:porin family protein [Spirosoma montaniterrae]AQG80387.1 hypothetical protein AWR27_14285 [Spirosoma montaniterrae]
MEKALLLLVVSIGISLSAQAQLRYGLTAGLQSAKMRFSGSGLSISTQGQVGVHLGAVAEFSLSEKFVLRPQFGLSLKGGRLLDDGDVLRTNLTYLELPVHLAYKHELASGNKLVGGIGPYFGFLLGGNSDGERIVTGEDLKGFDAGLSLMGGYEITDKNLTVNLFLNPGMANLVPGLNSSDVKATNSTFGLSVSYFLGGQ